MRNEEHRIGWRAKNQREIAVESQEERRRQNIYIYKMKNELWGSGLERKEKEEVGTWEYG